ncbi:hypothetical protein ACPYO6_03465 [Georgenia sp. Z1344]|uniref:hypothetical protein n=1 Tax=Georgenia sp. Z1344 TaxID=3416706 RepID=UPI003CFADAC4
MTTPSNGRQPAPTTDPAPPRSSEEERAHELGRWSTAASVLVIGSALGTLVVTRFPATIGLGVLALLGVAAAVYARRFREPRSGTDARSNPAGAPAGRTTDPRGGAGVPGTGVPGVLPPRRGGSSPPGRGTSEDGGSSERPAGPTLAQRRERSLTVTVVIGSIIAALHLVPAFAWNMQMENQECLDGAVTNQGRDACANELDDQLRGLLPTG